MNLAWFPRRSCFPSACFPACLAMLIFVGGTFLAADEPNWKPLFDGKTLTGWKITNFGGEGEVTVKDEQIVMEFGSSLTGITYEGEFPKTNFEISLEAMRVDGGDFFCGLTFPVAESHCSLILGGWGGAIVGLSSIDGHDASENETTQYRRFESGQWYKVRVRVTPERIEAWIDDKVAVDQDIVGRKITTRREVDLSKPLGISAYETRAALRKLQYRELPK
ncbi:MAG: DUF1080 domain-containing protein [Planctomycetota bacterium]